MTEDQTQLQMLLYEVTDIQEDTICLRLQQQPHGDRPESQSTRALCWIRPQCYINKKITEINVKPNGNDS